MNPYCSNESDYHQQLIDQIGRLPGPLKSEPSHRVFVWGDEVNLLDAGRGGGNRSADLFTVDEGGRVWLIEAKFGYNPELSRFVWEKQLFRYRAAIAKMSWQRILHYCESFLKGREGTTPSITMPADSKSFLDALELWQHQLGHALISPAELNERIATALGTGIYGIMVMADSFVPEVVEYGTAFVHDGPLAYVQAVPTERGMQFGLRWYRPGVVAGATAVITDVDPQFDAWSSEVNIRCHPDAYAETLSPACRDLWLNTLRPGLVCLGWDGKPAAVKRMAFNVAFDVNGRSAPLLVVGWSEADAKKVTRENKRAGQASMKVNPQLKRLLNFTGDIELTNRWAKRFHEIGWRARPKSGMRERWGVVPVTAEEFQGAEGVMLYQPDAAVRDHIGRLGDHDSLESLLTTLGELLDELRKERRG